MSTIKCNSNGDFDLSSGGISLISDLEEVIQTCEQTARQSRGELEYSLTKGVSYFDNVFLNNFNEQFFSAQLRDQLLTVRNVEEVIIILVEKTGDKLRYEATIKSIFGQGAVRGLI